MTGAGSALPAQPSTMPNRAAASAPPMTSACLCSRNATISSRERAMRFLHMTMGGRDTRRVRRTDARVGRGRAGPQSCAPLGSRCLTSPLNSRLTVRNPVRGCGGTVMLPSARHRHAPLGHVLGAVVTMKHYAPMRLRARCGNVRRTVIARGPSSGTSRGSSTWMPASSCSPHTSSADSTRRLLTPPPYVAGAPDDSTVGSTAGSATRRCSSTPS